MELVRIRWIEIGIPKKEESVAYVEQYQIIQLNQEVKQEKKELL